MKSEICFHAVLLKADFASCEPSCLFRYLCAHHIFTVNVFCSIVIVFAFLPKLIVSQVRISENEKKAYHAVCKGFCVTIIGEDRVLRVAITRAIFTTSLHQSKPSGQFYVL